MKQALLGALDSITPRSILRGVLLTYVMWFVAAATFGYEQVTEDFGSLLDRIGLPAPDATETGEMPERLASPPGQEPPS